MHTRICTHCHYTAPLLYLTYPLPHPHDRVIVVCGTIAQEQAEGHRSTSLDTARGGGGEGNKIFYKKYITAKEHSMPTVDLNGKRSVCRATDVYCGNCKNRTFSSLLSR